MLLSYFINSLFYVNCYQKLENETVWHAFENHVLSNIFKVQMCTGMIKELSNDFTFQQTSAVKPQNQCLVTKFLVFPGGRHSEEW